MYRGSSKQNRFMIDKMKAEGFKKGSRSIFGDQMNWVHDDEIVLKRVSDGGILTDLPNGSMVFNAKQAENLWDLSNMSLVDMTPNIQMPKLPDVQSRQTTSAPTQIQDLNVTFELPNVKDTDDFINDMQRSKRFENMVLDITFGQALGGNSFNKLRR